MSFSKIRMSKGASIKFLYIPGNEVLTVEGKILGAYTTHSGLEYIYVKPPNENSALCYWSFVVDGSIELTQVEQ